MPDVKPFVYYRLLWTIKWRLFLKSLNKRVCKVLGHDLVYKGYHSAPATYLGKPWPFKCNYAVYECRWCGENNKLDTGQVVRVEDLWKEGKRNKRSLI